MTQYTPEQEQAVGRVHNALASEFKVLGPQVEEDFEIVGTPLLSTWVCVSDWVDEAGESFTVTFGSPGLTRTQRIGLLDSHWHD